MHMQRFERKRKQAEHEKPLESYGALPLALEEQSQRFCFSA